jgi:hypothetical protein
MWVYMACLPYRARSVGGPDLARHLGLREGVGQHLHALFDGIGVAKCAPDHPVLRLAHHLCEEFLLGGDAQSPTEEGRMRKRLVALGVSATLVGSGVVIGAMVPALPQQQGTTTFTVCEQFRTEYLKEIDVAKKGFSAGDTILFANRVVNPQTGKGRGRLVGKAVIIRRFLKREDASFIADFSFLFPKGKVSLYAAGQESDLLRRQAKFGITGGTGSYSRVRGEVVSEFGKCRGKRGARYTLNFVRQ